MSELMRWRQHAERGTTSSVCFADSFPARGSHGTDGGKRIMKGEERRVRRRRTGGDHSDGW